MTTIKCGEGGRGGKDGSPVILSVSIRYFLHMCCYINKEYGVTIPELGKKKIEQSGYLVLVRASVSRILAL